MKSSPRIYEPVPQLSGEEGFTLLELMISMAIGTVIIVALTNTFVIQRRSYDMQQQVAAATQMARAAIDMMTREIQVAGYNPAGASFDGVAYSAAQLQIQADLNGDGDTGDTDETIIYSHDAGNLRIDRNAQPFVENIQTFSFEYLNSAGSATTVSSDIRQLRLTITARTDKPDPDFGSNGGYRRFTLKTLVTPKNVGL